MAGMTEMVGEVRERQELVVGAAADMRALLKDIHLVKEGVSSGRERDRGADAGSRCGLQTGGRRGAPGLAVALPRPRSDDLRGWDTRVSAQGLFGAVAAMSNNDDDRLWRDFYASCLSTATIPNSDGKSHGVGRKLTRQARRQRHFDRSSTR